MSQLSEIRSDVQDNLPSGYHTTLLTDSKVDELINKFQKRINTVHNFEFCKQEVTRPTVDAQQKYSVPVASDTDWTELNSETVLKFKEEYDAWLINSENYIVPLTKNFKKQLQDNPIFKDTSDKGTPNHWCIEQDYLWLFEKPSHSVNNNTAWTIHLTYFGYLADLSGDTDTNWITDNHPELLEYGGTSLCFEIGLDYEQAKYWENKARDVLLEIISSDISKKVSAMEAGVVPTTGQSLGNHTFGNTKSDLTAHYE